MSGLSLPTTTPYPGHWTFKYIRTCYRHWHADTNPYSSDNEFFHCLYTVRVPNFTFCASHVQSNTHRYIMCTLCVVYILLKLVLYIGRGGSRWLIYWTVGQHSGNVWNHFLPEQFCSVSSHWEGVQGTFIIIYDKIEQVETLSLCTHLFCFTLMRTDNNHHHLCC